MTLTSDSSVYYHDDDPDDPFVEDPNRLAQEDDWSPCYACDCTGLDELCRCSCHSTKRHH